MINDNDQHNSYGKTSSVNYNDATYADQQKQAKVANINRDFDQKIVFVKNNRHLSNREKTRQIQMLQNQCNNEIKKLDMQYVASDHSRNAKYDTHKW